jgi:hypothetical protein
VPPGSTTVSGGIRNIPRRDLPLTAVSFAAWAAPSNHERSAINMNRMIDGKTRISISEQELKMNSKMMFWNCAQLWMQH